MTQIALSVIPLVFVFLVLLGALSDLSSFKIPNAVSYGLVLLFLLQSILGWFDTPYMPSLSFHIPQYWIDVATSFGIAFVVLVVAVIFWTRGWIGGGDAKYLAATSLWMGPIGVIQYMLILSVLSIAMALVLKLSARWGFLVHAARLPGFVKRLYAKIEDNQLPYGFPMGIAALIMIPQIFKI